MTALSLAHELKKRNEQEPDETKKNILMLERGTWWTTPVGTVQDPEVKTYNFLAKDHNQPVQYWPSKNSFKGVIDIVTRCFRQGKNRDGLYDLTALGWRWPISLFRKGDGVTILRANGVGGGSLVYSNITIRPPDLIFNDPRWPIKWDEQERHDYYNVARDAIGNSVLFALNERDAKRITPVKPAVKSVSGEVDSYVPEKTITLQQPDPKKPGEHTLVTYTLDPQVELPKAQPPNDLRLKRGVWLFLSSTSGEERVTRIEMQGPSKINTGLSNIVTRSARLDPHWDVANDPLNPRGVKRIVPTNKKSPNPPAPDPNVDPAPNNELWIDRARLFQEAVSEITSDFGVVDLAINDITPEPGAFDTKGAPKNYCERQGRCNVGCLPGARHTLNKQLMRAAHGAFGDKPQPPLFDNLKINALAEVDFIEELENGGYKIHYDHYEHRNEGQPGQRKRVTVTADKVIVAAGCMGTNEIMLRSKKKEGLPGLSEEVGNGFSTNGDYIAFMEKTKKPARLTRGPVTTSFAHFNTDDAGDDLDPKKPKFHTLEDQGIPPAFASLVGFGLPLVRSLSKGRNRHLFLLWAILLWVLKRGRQYIKAPFVNYRKRQDVFKSEDELSHNMMCVIAMGREAAVGQFRLGGLRQTSLRVERTDGKKFHEDPVYDWGKDDAGDKDNAEDQPDKEKPINIKKSLGRLATQLGTDEKGEFVNPFLTSVFRKFKVDSITLSHPLGGCRMAEDVEHGVVDEYGRVFDKRKRDQEQRFYDGLYIADGSIIPTALGVNPSLTISTLALRVADKVIEEL